MGLSKPGSLLRRDYLGKLSVAVGSQDVPANPQKGGKGCAGMARTGHDPYTSQACNLQPHAAIIAEIGRTPRLWRNIHPQFLQDMERQ